MKKMLLSALAACGMMSGSAYAQLDLGGAISAGVNQATGAGQAAGAGAGLNAGVNQAAGATQGSGAFGARANSGLGGGVNQAAGAAQGFNAGSQLGSQLGGQIGSRIGGSTGSPLGAQVGGQLGAQVGGQSGTRVGNQLGAPNLGAQSNAQFGAQAGGNQGWFGGISNDFRSALQPGNNGNMVFRDNLDPSLQRYGFQPGDQVIGMNGQPLQQGQLDAYLAQNPGQVRVLRNGQTVVLGGNTQMYGQGYGQPYGQGYSQGYAQGGVGYNQGGMHGSMHAGGRQRLGITMNPSSDSVIISSVAQGSPAEEAGLRAGDQILAVNGRTVSNPNAMIQAVSQVGASQSLALQYRRDGQVSESQVLLGGNIGQQRAGYGDPGRGPGMGQGDVNSRIDNLERMLHELRSEIRQLGGAGAQGSVRGSADASVDTNDNSSERANDRDRSDDSSNQ